MTISMGIVPALTDGEFCTRAGIEVAGSNESVILLKLENGRTKIMIGDAIRNCQAVSELVQRPFCVARAASGVAGRRAMTGLS